MAILKVFALEVEFPAESRFCQRSKEVVELSHGYLT